MCHAAEGDRGAVHRAAREPQGADGAWAPGPDDDHDGDDVMMMINTIHPRIKDDH